MLMPPPSTAFGKEQCHRSDNETLVSSLDVVPKLVNEYFTETEAVVKEAERRGHAVGRARSIEFGDDFLRPEARAAALQALEDEPTYLLVIAFPCGPWSTITRCFPGKNLFERRRLGQILLNFAVDCALKQMALGRHFLIENPWYAESWSVDSLLALRADARVGFLGIHQCALDKTDPVGRLIKKPTGLLSDLPEVLEEFEQALCSKDTGR